MDKSFWHQKWKNNEIAFHGSQANPLLVQSFHLLSLAKGSRIFVPLCGKTLDLSWFLSNGDRVVGAELSKKAIEQLFHELGLEPTISRIDNFDLYQAKNIDIFVGDFFEVTQTMLEHVDAIYDRAVLVALPTDMRHRYTAHLKEITDKAPQLLICYEYNQNLMDGPPFSITSEEIFRHYQDHYQIDLIASVETPEGIKGKCPAKENVWLFRMIK